MNLSSQGIEILVLAYTAHEQTEYLQRNLQRLPQHLNVPSRARVTQLFPRKTRQPSTNSHNRL